jgi:hypothetical protein
MRRNKTWSGAHKNPIPRFSGGLPTDVLRNIFRKNVRKKFSKRWKFYKKMKLENESTVLKRNEERQTFLEKLERKKKKMFIQKPSKSVHQEREDKELRTTELILDSIFIHYIIHSERFQINQTSSKSTNVARRSK